MRSADVWKKLFISNIPEEVPNEYIERLLRVSGDLKQFTRKKDPKGILMKFGYAEFDNPEVIIFCIINMYLVCYQMCKTF